MSLPSGEARFARISVLLGVVITVAVTAVFWVTDLDFSLQSLVYSDIEPHWPYAERQPWRMLHDFGTLPGILLALVATLGLGASFLFASASKSRFPALYVFLLAAMGPGLVTNVLGKVLFGRPRPNEIIEFGGSLAFHRPFELGTPGRGFSFLCGHCSMGFLFLAFFFLLRGWKRWVALFLSLGLGLLLGMGRVIQAAHFPSDVLLDAAVMFIVAAALSPVASVAILPARRVSRWKVLVGTSAAAVLLVAGFLFSTPVHKDHLVRWMEGDFGGSPGPREKKLRWTASSRAVAVEVEKGTIDFGIARQQEPLLIHSLVVGYGFPGAGVSTDLDQQDGVIGFRHRLTGMYWESHGTYRVTVPENTTLRVTLKTGEGDVSINVADLRRPVLLSGSFRLDDPNHQFSAENGNRYVRPGTGSPLLISARADRVVIR